MLFIKKSVILKLALAAALASLCAPVSAEDLGSLTFISQKGAVKRAFPNSAFVDGEIKSDEMGFLYDKWRDGDITLSLHPNSQEVMIRVEQRVVTFVALSDDGYCGTLNEINAATKWTTLDEESANTYRLRKLQEINPKVSQQELLRLTKEQHPELIGLAQNRNYVFSSRIELRLSFFNGGKLSSYKEIKMPPSLVCL